MLKFHNTLLAAGLCISLGGCITYGPQSAYLKSIVGRPIYGQVNSFNRSMASACTNSQTHDAPFCKDQENYVWVGTLVGQHGIGLLHKNALAVPKSAGVEEGDIIEYHATDIEHPWAIFDRIAAKKPTETDNSKCRWEGSHFSTGGVVCDGWRWNKDFPPAAD